MSPKAHGNNAKKGKLPLARGQPVGGPLIMETCLLRLRMIAGNNKTYPPQMLTQEGPGVNSRFRTDGGLSGMVVDLLEPTHGPQIGSSARRNRDGFPPVKAGYWKAAARRLQKACKTSVFSPGRKKEKRLVSKKKSPEGDCKRKPGTGYFSSNKSSWSGS